MDGFAWALVPQTFANITILLIFSAGEGFVSIRHPAKHGLPLGMPEQPPSPDSQVFGVSMYHQLHCLVSVCVIDGSIYS